MSNSDESPLEVPGFGLPVNYEQDRTWPPFYHGADDAEFERMTVREVSMLGLMEALTDKPAWSEKVFDKDITAKWRNEALEMPYISEKAFDWCLMELQDKAQEYKVTGLVTVLDMGSRCVKADHLVPTEIQSALKLGTKSLLDQSPPDWHPGSNEQVLNVVHPSLYPAVYGKTPVLQHSRTKIGDPFAPLHDTNVLPPANIVARVSTGIAAWWPPSGQTIRKDCWSSNFQWLPCDVAFANTAGTSVKITSYINNLHPVKYRNLYHTIESLISLSIPAWNQVLVNSSEGRTPLRIKIAWAETDPPRAPDLTKCLRRHDDPLYDESYQTALSRVREYLALPDRPGAKGMEVPPRDWENNRLWSAIEWKFHRTRKTIHPEPGVGHRKTYADWKAGTFNDPSDDTIYQFGFNRPYGSRRNFEYTTVNIQDQFRDIGLQVIVKIASIELTPHKPSYPGGNWHLEGMLNEHIVATSIYYFDAANVTEPRIRFRQEAKLGRSDVGYEQGDHEPLCEVFGTEALKDEDAIQEVGSIATPEGRLLAFSNTLQHKVEPFQLADPGKAGHRRFLVLWLVDPLYKILSTANVPPQQYEWWVDKSSKALSERVPTEVWSMIDEELKKGTMTLEEAKEYRLQLMAERTNFTDTFQRTIEQYNFCEH